MNNPLKFTDPSGLWCVWDDNSGHEKDPQDGGWGSEDCAKQGGHWDPTDTITNMVADANGNVNFVQTNSGIFNVAGLGYNTVNIDQMSPFVDMRPFLSSASISAQDNWLYTKQADCAVAGAKAFVGGFIMKKEIDSGVDFLAGQSLDETVPGMVTGGTMAKGAEVGLDHAAESRPLTTAVRAALREEGHKVSANAVGRGFKFFSRAALAVHVGLAMNEGREEYNACMAD